MLKRVNDVREGRYDYFDEPTRDYYHKPGMPKEEIKKKHKIEENKKKKREEKMKMIEDERRKKMQDILEKETAKFKFANKKEDIVTASQKNIQIGTEKFFRSTYFL